MHNKINRGKNGFSAIPFMQKWADHSKILGEWIIKKFTKEAGHVFVEPTTLAVTISVASYPFPSFLNG